MRLLITPALVLLGTSLVAAPLVAQQAGIVGSWRGSSTCTDKAHFPGCHDEQVIYDVARTGSSRDSVTLRADKIVNGVRDFMGESYFGHAADGSWVAKLQMGPNEGRMVIHITGNHMTGALTDVGSGRAFRSMVLDRMRP